MRIAFLAALTALAAAAPVAAKDKKPVDPNKKVCRSEAATGSIFTKSICHTVAEWSQIDGQNHAAVEESRRDSANTAPAR